MKKLLLLILLSTSFSVNALTISEPYPTWKCNDGYILSFDKNRCVKIGEDENEIVKILNEEILTSYDQENSGEVDEFLMVYLDRCIDYTTKKVSNEEALAFAKRNQRIRKLSKLSNEAEDEYIKVLKGCYSSLDTGDLSGRLSCLKEKEKEYEKFMETRAILVLETSIKIMPLNPQNVALRFCADWYSEIKSKLTNIEPLPMETTIGD